MVSLCFPGLVLITWEDPCMPSTPMSVWCRGGGELKTVSSKFCFLDDDSKQ